MNTLRKLPSIILLFLCSCGPSISLFDQYAYVQVTNIKVEALDLMGQATDAYSAHEKEIKVVDQQIRKAMEYEKHRPKNAITSVLWEKLNDPGAHLYGGFINRWREKGKLDTAFANGQQYIISRAFDQIAELESGKIKK